MSETGCVIHIRVLNTDWQDRLTFLRAYEHPEKVEFSKPDKEDESRVLVKFESCGQAYVIELQTVADAEGVLATKEAIEVDKTEVVSEVIVELGSTELRVVGLDAV
ncbi:hypothetical protein FGG08_004032 [Glutinoglossum americanum]|uniref:Uncharacterized protein n=1 Tax=Glutinoglossum americanum TaxID=1670608 RepID=A0A9P8L498_9PEZI|nr:hypothetical protein FGG08_004032 [Glutinoglossum americanum]